MAGQADVARLAGVSQKTVSRVINAAPHVRPDVRIRVEEAIRALSYRPNVAAQALARDRTHRFGVLALGTGLIGPSRRIYSLELEARRQGYAMSLVAVPDLTATSVTDGVGALLSQGVEGIVIEVPNHLVEIDPHQLGSLPVVTSAGWIEGIAAQAVVDIDQEEACFEATTYLLDAGHETVWHIAGPRDWDAAEKRRAGWQGALLAAGREVPQALYGDWSAAAGYRHGQTLAARPDVTAVLVGNDQMAMGVLRALHEAGRRIPGDVSVVGFDDVPEAEFQMVPLSSVGVDSEHAARRILAELLHLIEGGEPPSHRITLTNTTLIIRGSSGPRSSSPLPPTV